MEFEKAKARLIAFYLPQYHPIPENDLWWGKGFTEWTNVTKARPLFPGHCQPDLPGDLGFYDLRVPEVRKLQSDLARSHGIEGFCYWHYWFGNGRRVLDRIFTEVLESGEPNFPFCLGWANETWTGVWHGLGDKILMKQEYPGEEDYIAHFQFLLRAFHDPRYIRVNGRPLLVIFRGDQLPNSAEVCALWRRLAQKNGLPGLHIATIVVKTEQAKALGYDAVRTSEPGTLGYDAAITSEPGTFSTLGTLQNPLSLQFRVRRKARRWLGKSELLPKQPRIYSYAECAEKYYQLPPLPSYVHPCVFPNWDNTPRSGVRGLVFADANPKLFEGVLRKTIADVADRPYEERLIFVKSWNEWAEGNYLEPSVRFGHGYLEAARNEVIAGKSELVACPVAPARPSGIPSPRSFT